MGEKVLIRREYFVNIDSLADVKLMFRTSRGETPIVTVDMTQTYQAKAIVVDSKGMPIQDVMITFDDTFVKTDKNGVAFLNLEYGNKTITMSKNGYRTEIDSIYLSSNIKEKTFTLRSN